ncbi:hypothetical protein RclHR1_06420016 [Rhizophagus clarus]|uniref:Uncharacterized protein n=1 Tax=Rhizophagus clarus TaxID=94130 RepID=A0A2Z6RY03_9GLOM|nr:hypothetical protein RclHR1_06420016 [Rhizophagus clarus]GES91973.1 hypothetical protein GLOIN_2v1641119 [Rhizophagus clarus]
MKANVRTNAERETLARLGELVTSLSPPPEESNNNVKGDINKDDVEMDEADDEIFALPQQFSKGKYFSTDYVDSSLISPPLSALDIDDEDEQKDILQDFNNRDKKVQELITLNKQDFEKIKQSFNSSEEEWKRFERVLYAKYEIVPDREWFDTLREFIDPMNPLLTKFEELVSGSPQIEIDNEEEINNSYRVTPDQTSEIDDDTHSLPYNSTTGSRRESRDENFMRLQDVDIKIIRDYPEKLLNFENVYLDFFTNVKNCFGQECRRLVKQESCYKNSDDDYISNYGEYNGDDESFITEGLRANVQDHRQACEDSELYERFVQILLTPRRMMPDDLWEEAIYECLNDWPYLIDQLKEIIAYEVSNENIKGVFEDSQDIVIM